MCVKIVTDVPRTNGAELDPLRKKPLGQPEFRTDEFPAVNTFPIPRSVAATAFTLALIVRL